jgi:hypothetical protein
MAVCDKTYRLLQQEPYTDMFEAIEPRHPIPIEDAQTFDCRRSAGRHARETKGHNYTATTESLGPCCGDKEPCC